MTKVIEALREEHRHVAMLLDALEREMAAFDRGEVPDYPLVNEILDYFATYPDRYHHPKEDLVLARLRERDPEAAARVGELEAEHRELAEATRTLAALVEAVLEESEVERERVHEAGRDFVRRQREHMEREERDFFPAADRALHGADWATLHMTMSDPYDPLFGPRVEKRFAALRESLGLSTGPGT